MSKPRLLDLFCGAGGAAMGYHRAGFEVVGVDIKPQPNYPFEFVQDDALVYLNPGWFDLGDFDAIHASPPCQAYSSFAKLWPGRNHPELIEPTREALRATGLPYIIENVIGAPLLSPVMLCGGGLVMPVVRCDDGVQRQVRRHRLFETNWPLLVPPCWHPYPSLGVYGTGGRWHDTRTPNPGRGGYQGDTKEKAEGMGIDWMKGASEVSEAIPPAYTELIGHQLLQHIKAKAAA